MGEGTSSGVRNGYVCDINKKVLNVLKKRENGKATELVAVYILVE